MKEIKGKQLLLVIVMLTTVLITLTGCNKSKVDTTLSKEQLYELITLGKVVVSGYHTDIKDENLALIDKHCTEEGASQVKEVISKTYGTQGDGFINLQSDIDKLKETGEELSLDERIVEKDGELGVYRKDLEFDSYTEFVKLTDTEYREIKYTDTKLTREEIKADSGYNLGLRDYGFYENGLLKLKFITIRDEEDTNNTNNRPILNDIQFENAKETAVQTNYTVEVSMWIQDGKIAKYEQEVVSR